MKIKHPGTAYGFTLVETLVAISVLLIVIIGPITAAQKGIRQAYYANEQLAAVFISQEAIEAIRRARDDRALDVWNRGSGSNETSTWVPAVCASPNSCDVNTSGTFVSCSGSCADITRNNVNYSRRLTVGSAVGGGRLVTVTTTWSNEQLFGGVSQTVVLQTYLYDHYQRFEN